MHSTEYLIAQILHFCKKGATYPQMLQNLDGVDPKILFEALSKLINENILIKNGEYYILKSIKSKESFIEHKQEYNNSIKFGKNKPYKPHPLSYRWIFSKNTIKEVFNLYILKNDIQKILLAAIPSIFEVFFSNKHLPGSVALVDIDRDLYLKYKNKLSSKCQFYCEDLTADLSIADLRYSLAILDPPWYMEYYYSFILNVARMLDVNGRILLVAPSLNTRPGIFLERVELYNFLTSIGFHIESIHPKFISYLTPFFEYNTYVNQGIKITPFWRKADLIVLRKIQPINQFEHTFDNRNLQDEWERYIIDNVEIRIKNCKNSINLDNNYFESIFDDGLLPSVSRRLVERSDINFWTSGNRGFIVSNSESVINVVQKITNKDFSFCEEEKKIFKFIKRLVNKEKKEYIAYSKWINYASLE